MRLIEMDGQEGCGDCGVAAGRHCCPDAWRIVVLRRGLCCEAIGDRTLCV